MASAIGPLQPGEPEVELFARALWDAQYPTGTSWDDWATHLANNPDSFDGRETCRKLARGALSAVGHSEREKIVARKEALEVAAKFLEEHGYCDTPGNEGAADAIRKLIEEPE